MRRLAPLLTGLLAVLAPLQSEAGEAQPSTPAAVLAAAPPDAWERLDPSDLLVVTLQGDRKVVIALADAFAPAHVANIRRLAREHWYDRLAVERVQDDYVAQWGDPDGKKPLPSDVGKSVPAEYDRPAAGLDVQPLPYRDTYASATGASGAFPVAVQDGRAWLTHCYGMVGVGRDLNPDTGSGAELYAVIGQPIRPLDRNIAVVGRVVDGIEALSALPRGTGDLGFYTDPQQRTPIASVRLASDLPPAEQPRLEVLKPENASYRAWVQARANRRDSFFLRPAGAADVCSVMPPVRRTAG